MTYHGMKFSKKELADMGLSDGNAEEIGRLSKENMELTIENAKLKARLYRTRLELDRLTLAIGGKV
jgi:regulator of replication initiation timing